MINISICAFKFLNFLVSLFYNFKALSHLFISNQKAIITISCCTYRYGKIKILVTAVRRMNTHIIIYTRCTEVGTCKTII